MFDPDRWLAKYASAWEKMARKRRDERERDRSPSISGSSSASTSPAPSPVRAARSSRKKSSSYPTSPHHRHGSSALESPLETYMRTPKRGAPERDGVEAMMEQAAGKLDDDRVAEDVAQRALRGLMRRRSSSTLSTTSVPTPPRTAASFSPPHLPDYREKRSSADIGMIELRTVDGGGGGGGGGGTWDAGESGAPSGALPSDSSDDGEHAGEEVMRMRRRGTFGRGVPTLDEDDFFAIESGDAYVPDERWRSVVTLQQAQAATYVTRRIPHFVPVIKWLPQYNFQFFVADLIAGITVGLVMIPQSLAYAMLAHLPPIYGLYTALVCTFVYGILGTSRQLSIGPEGVISLLSGAALAFDTTSDSVENYVIRASVLAFLVGVFTFLLGLFRVGFLNNLVSRGILHGFITASALIIAIEQLDAFLGIDLEEHEWYKAVECLQNISKAHPMTCLFGIMFVIVLVGFDQLKRLARTLEVNMDMVPSPAVVVALGIVLSYTLRLEEQGVDVLGHISGGFPIPAIPQLWHSQAIRELFVPAVLISIVGFVESLAVAKSYATKHSYSISANRELTALGIANVVASFFQSYPAFGSLSRSYICDKAGGTTQMASFVASGVILVCLFFMMPVFAYLPLVTIAAIIMVAAVELVHLDIIHLCKMHAWAELFLTGLSFLSTFFLGPELGIIIALGVSIFLVIRHTTMPSIHVLGFTSDGKWKDISENKDATFLPGIVVMRIDESLFFGNVGQLKQLFWRIERLGSATANLFDTPSIPDEVHGIVLDARNIHSVDVNALEVLREIIEDYQRRDMTFCIVKWPSAMREQLERSGIASLMGTGLFFNSTREAVEHLLEKQAEERVARSKVTIEVSDATG